MSGGAGAREGRWASDRMIFDLAMTAAEEAA